MWKPIEQSNIASFLSVAHEGLSLDLKREYDISKPTTIHEMAKDMAAFANAMGGTILVGCIEGRGERKGRPVRFVGVSKPGEFISKVKPASELCRPVPVVHPVEVELSIEDQAAITGQRPAQDVRLVVINVSPYLLTPIGYVVCDKDGNRLEDAYRFPVRLAEATSFLRPEELSFHMNHHERRMMLQLASIRNEPQVILWSDPKDGRRNIFRISKIVDLDQGLSMVRFKYLQGKSGDWRAEVPLAFVRAVWPSSKGWNVSIEGSVFELALDAMGHQGFVPPGALVQ